MHYYFSDFTLRPPACKTISVFHNNKIISVFLNVPFIFMLLFLQRKNWTTSWTVLTGWKIEFYKESKQPAVANLVSHIIFLMSHLLRNMIEYKV